MYYIEPIFWNWLILACLFLAIEAFTASFFFIFWAMAALTLTLLTWLMPELGIQSQALAFSLLSIISITAWWFITKAWQPKNHNDEAAKLNYRSRNLIGRHLVLEMPIVHGSGRVKIDDGMWTIRGEDMPAGTTVLVVNVDSLVLDVVKVG